MGANEKDSAYEKSISSPDTLEPPELEDRQYDIQYEHISKNKRMDAEDGIDEGISDMKELNEQTQDELPLNLEKQENDSIASNHDSDESAIDVSESQTITSDNSSNKMKNLLPENDAIKSDSSTRYSENSSVSVSSHVSEVENTDNNTSSDADSKKQSKKKRKRRNKEPSKNQHNKNSENRSPSVSSTEIAVECSNCENSINAEELPSSKNTNQSLENSECENSISSSSMKENPKIVEVPAKNVPSTKPILWTDLENKLSPNITETKNVDKRQALDSLMLEIEKQLDKDVVNKLHGLIDSVISDGVQTAAHSCVVAANLTEKLKASKLSNEAFIPHTTRPKLDTIPEVPTKASVPLDTTNEQTVIELSNSVMNSDRTSNEQVSHLNDVNPQPEVASLPSQNSDKASIESPRPILTAVEKWLEQQPAPLEQPDFSDNEDDEDEIEEEIDDEQTNSAVPKNWVANPPIVPSNELYVNGASGLDHRCCTAYVDGAVARVGFRFDSPAFETSEDVYDDISQQEICNPSRCSKYYQLSTNIEDSEEGCSITTEDLNAIIYEESHTTKFSSEMKSIEEKSSEQKQRNKLNHARESSEIVIYEDDRYECDGEDVDLLTHQFDSSFTATTLNPNKLSLAEEIMETNEETPFDCQLKPGNSEKPSCSNIDILEKHYGNRKVDACDSGLGSDESDTEKLGNSHSQQDFLKHRIHGFSHNDTNPINAAFIRDFGGEGPLPCGVCCVIQ